MRKISCLKLLLCSALLAMSGCSQGPSAWWHSVNSKAKALSRAEADYHALAKEHERLKQEYFRLEQAHMELRAKHESAESGQRNLAATGALNGRSLASVHYQVPKGLKPAEISSLAFEHFNEKRFAEAAVTFDFLLKTPEAANHADATALYTAGVACFQIGNFVKAKEYLSDANRTATGEQKEKVHKKVDLWMRVIDRKLASEGGGGHLGG